MALRSAAPHLPPNLPRSQQVRELAIEGARHLAAVGPDEATRRKRLEELAEDFRHPGAAPWDREALLEVKQRAWPVR